MERETDKKKEIDKNGRRHSKREGDIQIWRKTYKEGGKHTKTEDDRQR